MTEDPYRAPGAEIHTDADATGLPLVLLAASSLLLLAIAGWCFFLSDALATLSVPGSARIESIERVSRQIRDSNSIPNPESIEQYLEQNREFLLDDIGYQRSAQLNLMLVGSGLVILFLGQLLLLHRLRRGQIRRAQACSEAGNFPR